MEMGPNAASGAGCSRPTRMAMVTTTTATAPAFGAFCDSAWNAVLLMTMMRKARILT